MRRAWLRRWFGRHCPGDAEALRALLTQLCRREAALACHLAERARAIRFAPHRLELEGVAARDRLSAQALARAVGVEDILSAEAAPARRPGTLTVSKLNQDLAETEALRPLYLRAGHLATDPALRRTLEERAADEARGSRTIRGILARMDSYVTDLP